MNENNAIVNINSEVMNKLLNLSEALAACDITSKVFVEPDGSLYLSAPLWNCEDGSGDVLGVYALPVEGFEIGHAIQPAGLDYDELVEEYPPIEE